MKLYDFKVKTITEKEITLKEYENSVMLIVNVASRCGFTNQYEGLEKLYQDYQQRGFVVLGFPCNQFAQQEPGTEAQIQQFCQTRFHVTFPLFSKIEVNGPHTHPLYAYLKTEARGVFGTEAIKWNFTKFLIDRTGHVVKRYGSQVTPSAIKGDIERLLDAAPKKPTKL